MGAIPSANFHSFGARAKRLDARAASSLAPAMLQSLQGILNKADPRALNEFQSILRNPDPEVLWEELIHLGLRLKADQKLDLAAPILGIAAQSAPVAGQRQRASREYETLTGKGGFGLKTEFLAGRFLTEATDPKLIVPMLAGTVVGRLASGVIGARLAQTAPMLLSRGFGARASAGAAGFLFEVPVFVGTQWALHGGDVSYTDQLKRAGLTLGMMKLGGGTIGAYSGHLGVFSGLLAAHHLEVRLGWRPSADGTTAVIDTLAAMASLNVGAHLGTRVLGPRLAGLSEELGAHTEAAAGQWRNSILNSMGLGGRSQSLGKRPAFQSAAIGPGLPFQPGPSLIANGKPLLMEGSGKDDGTPPGSPKPPSTDPSLKDTALVPKEKEWGRIGFSPEYFRRDDIPVARIVRSPQLKDQGIGAFLRRHFGPLTPLKVAGLTFAGSLPFVTLAPGSALVILGTGWLAGKIGLDLRRRIRELMKSPPEPPKLLGPAQVFHSHTMKRDPNFLIRATDIQVFEVLKVKNQAWRREVELSVFLRTQLKGASPLELEAWLEALWPFEQRVEFLRQTQNPAGIALLKDIASAFGMDPAIRKRAIDTLAEIRAVEAVPQLMEILNERDLRYAAAGALVWLDPSKERARAVSSVVVSEEPDTQNPLQSGTDFFFEMRGTIERTLMFLGQALKKNQGEKFIQPVLETMRLWIPSIFEFLNSEPQFQAGLLHAAVAESLVDSGEREKVLEWNRDTLPYLFSPGGMFQYDILKVPEENLAARVRYARLVGKLDWKDRALHFLRRAKLELKSKPEKEPEAFLTLAEAYVELGQPAPAIPMLRPLLRHSDLKISLHAARLMDRAQPGWDGPQP